MNTTDRAVLQALVDATKRTHFTDGYKATDEEAFGLLMAKYFEYDARILQAASKALEDANFHSQSSVVDELYELVVKVDDDALIDRDTRSALFATLTERFGKLDRADRLRKLSVLAGREPSNPIRSLSDRYCDMTMGDARRVFDVLNVL